MSVGVNSGSITSTKWQGCLPSRYHPYATNSKIRSEVMGLDQRSDPRRLLPSMHQFSEPVVSLVADHMVERKNWKHYIGCVQDEGTWFNPITSSCSNNSQSGCFVYSHLAASTPDVGEDDCTITQQSQRASILCLQCVAEQHVDHQRQSGQSQIPKSQDDSSITIAFLEKVFTCR